MFSSKIKFKYKIYSITFFVVLFFLFWSIFSHSLSQNISDTIAQLTQTNDKIQKNLVIFADVEKIKRYIYEYSTNGDSVYIKPIESLFDSFEEINPASVSFSKEYSYTYKKLLENIAKYRSDFEIAKEQIPLNFLLRKELREHAQTLEKLINDIKIGVQRNEDMLKLLHFRKALLEVEKGSVRYFETDNVNYVMKTMQELKSVEKIINQLHHNGFFTRDKLRLEILESLGTFEKIVQKTIEHYRTYSMLTKIVMPGDADEIHHYSKKLRALTLQERKRVHSQINYYIERNKQLNVIMSTMFIVLILGSFFLIIHITLQPMRDLTIMFEKLAEGEDDVEIPEYQHKDEMGKLLYAANQYKIVNKKTKELLVEMQDYQENLEKRVQEEIFRRREHEKALIQQSKLASMGEMIGAIAHQWRQPLNELSIRIQKLKYAFIKGQIDEEFIGKFIEKNKNTIDFMSKTIDDFRNFFRIDKEKTSFAVKESIEEVINIQSAQLKDHNIALELEGEEFFFKGFKTEFQQVIINLISNSKDALISQKVQNPKIKIKVASPIISILDNAGGIDEDILERIFEPYFTTKPQGEGTGMGMYMSKMIIEDNMHSCIKLKNKDEGLLVDIELKKEL